MIGVVVLTVVAFWLSRPGEQGREAASVVSDSPPSPPATVGASDTEPGETVDLRAATAAPAPLEQAEALKREAVAIAQQVVARYPEDAVSYALLGSAYYNVGQSLEAVENLERCVALDPRQVEAYEILARVAYERGELEEAVRLCRVGLEKAPNQPELLKRLGRAQLDLGQTEGALAALRRAQRHADGSGETHYLLGQACLQAGDYAAARESFQEAIRRVPDHTQAFFGLFTACLRLGQAEEAQRHREAFLKLEASDRRTLTDRSTQEETLTGLPLVRQTVARTLVGAGQIYHLHQQPDEATPLLLKAARLDPDSAAARAALLAVFARRNAPDEAVAALQRLAGEQPENPLNHLFLGQLQKQLGGFEAAEQAYRKARDLAPERPEAYRFLAELYLSADRQPADARTAAERLIQLEPTGPHHYLLGVARARSGDRPGAIAAMEQAVVLSPNQPRFREFLEQLKSAP